MKGVMGSLLAGLMCLSIPVTAASQADIERCVMASSRQFHVHPDLIRAIIQTESSGRHGVVGKNTNRTSDLGLMQINTIHLPALKPYGVTRDKLINDACYNIATGTWLLKGHLAKAPPTPEGFWKAVGNYHSKTPHLNQVYQRRVWGNLQRIRSEK